MVFAQGVAPILADAAAYLGLVALGHAVMRFVSGPSRGSRLAGESTEPHVADQQKPDFSGAYALNPHASTLSPGAAAVRSAVVRIEHHEPIVRCQATFNFDARTFEFSLERVSDGREVVDQRESTVSSAHWDGNALVFMDRTKGPDSDVTMSWRYELVEGGRHLRAVEQIRGGGRDQDNVWVFERQ